MTSVDALPPGPVFDPADPAFMADPYPAYARIRESTAVWHPDGHHLWYLTRFADVHAGFRDRVMEDGSLRRFVNVFVAGEDVRFGDGVDTAVAEGQEVTILPAVAGGSAP